MMMRFLRWGWCCSRKRKKPTSSRTKSVLLLLKRVRVCVSVESKLEWARSLESSRRTPTKRERERESYTFWGETFSNDTRKIFKEIFWWEKPARARKNERERSRGEDFALAKSRTTRVWTRFFFLCEVIFGSLKKKGSQRTNFSKNFFPPLARFWVWTGRTRDVCLIERERQLRTEHTSTMAKRTKSARKAAKSVRRRACKWTTRERERERETLSLSSFALFLARPVVFI